MVGFYIIFGLLCFLLGFAIVSWFIVYKDIRNKIDNYSDYTEFIEFDDCLISINKIVAIVKYDCKISILINEEIIYIENFDNEKECNNRFSDILSCITYYPKD